MHKADCIFCQIAQKQAPAHVIWENHHHLAFLSIFPNTEGFTVVIPKDHYGSYAFEQTNTVLTELVIATKTVANILDAYFADVARCGMFFEGYGVDHLHSKLFPMHGTAGAPVDNSVETAKPDVFFDRYPGYLSSHDAQRADDDALATLAAQIRQSAVAVGKG